MPQRRRSARRPLAQSAAFCLEKRVLPSGNVTAVIDVDGNLFVGGDNSANNLSLRRIGPNVVLSGGRINGSNREFLVASDGNPLRGDIYFRLKGGKDNISVVGVDTPGSLFIASGSADDKVSVSGSSIGGVLNIGGDSVRPGQQLDDSGNDAIRLEDVQCSDLSIQQGTGHDVFHGVNLRVGYQAFISPGDGNDLTTIQDLTVGYGFHFRGGDGDDYSQFMTMNAGRAGILMDAGTDFLDLSRAQFTLAEESVYISLGEGDDRANVNNSHFAGTLIIDGYDGTDLIFALNSNASNVVEGPLLADSFESVDNQISPLEGDPFITLHYKASFKRLRRLLST